MMLSIKENLFLPSSHLLPLEVCTDISNDFLFPVCQNTCIYIFSPSPFVFMFPNCFYVISSVLSHLSCIHIVTGGLNIVKDRQVRKFLIKGPAYRKQNNVKG